MIPTDNSNWMLAAREIQQLKKVDRDLLNALKKEKLVIDWQKNQQAKAAI